MPLAVGSSFGAYEVLASIGAGGMGEVYRARDRKLGRDVALKILPPIFAADPDRMARFDREARLLAALSHPNIAAIHGAVEADGHHGLVLELIEGDTLIDVIARGPLPVAEALRLAGQIASALEAAHDKGIIHRDLKPANIKLTRDGVVKVLDFGLAKALQPDEDAAAADLSASPTITASGTRAGVILGTAAYMSPEQARGRVVDKRSDIWAFGCVLYEMLTATVTFGSQTMSDTLVAVLEREPAWDRLPATTPPRIRRLLRRCLVKDARGRLHDIADARIELEDAGADAVEGGPQVASGAIRARRWRVAALVASSALAAAAAYLFFVVGRTDTALSWPDIMAHSVPAQMTDHDGTESAAAIAPDGRSFAYVSSHGGTADVWLRRVVGGEPVRLTDDAAEESDLAYSPDGESVYFTRAERAGPSIWRIGALGGTPRRVLADARLPAPAPDGRRLAYYARNQDGRFVLTVSSLDGTAPRSLGRVLEGNTPPRWSPDGRSLAYVQALFFSAANVFIVDVESGAERQVTHFANSEEGVTSLAWLPDNRHLAVVFLPPQGDAERDLGIVDITNGRLTRLTYNVQQAFGGLSLAADGSRLLMTSFDHRHELWKVPLDGDADENGRRATRVLGDPYDPAWAFVSRDGQRLLFNGRQTGSRNLWIGPADLSTSPRQITDTLGNAVRHAELSPDGTRVAFGSRVSGHHDIWTQNVDGSEPRQLTTDSSVDTWPTWSPDGRWIVFNTTREGVAETWRVSADGGTPEKLDDGSFRGDWIRQPDGQGTWLVSWKPGRIRLLDVERRRVVWEQPLGGGGPSMPQFSPDGQLVSTVTSEGPGRSVVWLLDARTGQPRRMAVRFPGFFSAEFRVNWVDNGQALLVSRGENVSHVVMFDKFWSPVARDGR